MFVLAVNSIICDLFDFCSVSRTRLKNKTQELWICSIWRTGERPVSPRRRDPERRAQQFPVCYSGSLLVWAFPGNNALVTYRNFYYLRWSYEILLHMRLNGIKLRHIERDLVSRLGHVCAICNPGPLLAYHMTTAVCKCRLPQILFHRQIPDTHLVLSRSALFWNPNQLWYWNNIRNM